MLTTKDHLFCAFIATVLTLCAKWFFVTDTFAGGLLSSSLGYYFISLYDKYCWARALQETMKR